MEKITKPCIYFHNAYSPTFFKQELLGFEVSLRTSGDVVFTSSGREMKTLFSEYLSAWAISRPQLILSFKEHDLLDLVEKQLSKIDDLSAIQKKVILAEVPLKEAIEAEKRGFRTLSNRNKYEANFGPFYGHYVNGLKTLDDMHSCVYSMHHAFLVSPEVLGSPLVTKSRKLDEYIELSQKLQWEGIITDWPHMWQEKIGV